MIRFSKKKEKVDNDLSSQVEKIFSPGNGVDVVFNPDSATQITRSSLIYDCDHQSKTMIISQTSPPVLRSFEYEKMHITSLITTAFSRNTKKSRAGMNCMILKFIDHYALTNDNETRALQIEYQLPAFESNLRTAYRLELDMNIRSAAKLVCNGQTFLCGRHFNIYDISATGIGLLIPKKIEYAKNVMLDIKPGSKCSLGLALRNNHCEPSTIAVSTVAKFIWKNNNHNPANAFAGLKTIKISQKDEDALGKFIHESQLYEIRKYRLDSD